MLEAESTPCGMEGLGKLKKIRLIGTRSRDVPACSIVSQPTALPRAPHHSRRRHFCTNSLPLQNGLKGHCLLHCSPYPHWVAQSHSCAPPSTHRYAIFSKLCLHFCPENGGSRFLKNVAIELVGLAVML
jgi:hypothetical protein